MIDCMSQSCITSRCEFNVCHCSNCLRNVSLSNIYIWLLFLNRLFPYIFNLIIYFQTKNVLPIDPWTLDDSEIYIRTIIGEARGESEIGQAAVAFVILNRSKKSGKTIKEICLQPKQFSTWNKDDPNREIALNESKTSAIYQQIKLIVNKVQRNEMEDITYGSTHYHVKNMRKRPSWTKNKKPVVKIGAHSFYNNIQGNF